MRAPGCWRTRLQGVPTAALNQAPTASADAPLPSAWDAGSACSSASAAHMKRHPFVWARTTACCAETRREMANKQRIWPACWRWLHQGCSPLGNHTRTPEDV